jgi:DUF1680 family protein
LTWKEKELRLRQDTRFPEADTTHLTLRLAKPIKVALKVRYPGWAQALSVKVNKKVQKVEGQLGSYVAIERVGRYGDRVGLRVQ